ncbi:proteasome subunit beta type-7-like [Uloborus diversus]|uniref:proteasome subunit beta type-7-like n=1 Tax=Uloborus diversus TaxID=327109 RepID=UPI0024091750|nr:proteasome subunit beta type-7-like [Uloborus diversus]
MAESLKHPISTSGFKFDNYQRNAYLETKGVPGPKLTKTGTTIVGIIFKDGVILGADTRATTDTIVSDKNCLKIHFIADNIYCCGAGTAADTDVVTRMIAAQIKLHCLTTGRICPVMTANRLLKQHLFKYHGFLGVAGILGGVDMSGPSLYSIAPAGSTHKMQYSSMGSGSLAAMATLEKRWERDMPLEDGMRLVRDAIAGGIFSDLGSGSNIDLCVITMSGCKFIRPLEVPNKKGKMQQTYRYRPGVTSVISSKVTPLEVVECTVRNFSDSASEDSSVDED